MSAEIISNFNGVVTSRISGLLTESELSTVQKELFAIIGREGGVRLLIISEDFQGWDGASDWEDISFQSQSDPFINKMALVGDKKWKDLAFLFTGKGFREFPIEYFEPHELEKARAWLMEN